MAERYDHLAVEAKWRKIWEDRKAYRVDLKNAQKPFYNLMMFPYPSAEGLHVGNVFAFTGSDIYGRLMWMKGYQVFEPMGFDAFGIHSENYALKVGSHPARLVPANIRNFRENQLKKMGAIFDWDHQVDSTDPKYYKWTQWIFTQLHKRGLAYQREAPVNWCPSCKTVLSDEQAEDGRCERCSSEVEKRSMQQWFLKITHYAQRLLDDLEWIDWSEITKAAQRRWIGRSEGARVVFPLAGRSEWIEVFTTRPDTLFGATYMVLAPEHPLIDAVTSRDRKAEVAEYLKVSGRIGRIDRENAAREKTGVFTGAYALNPMNDREIPIWVSDYVLMSYGTGAIMAVPAHDTRDFEFAMKFGLPIIQVISENGREHPLAEAYSGEGSLVNSGKYDSVANRRAMELITAELESKCLGGKTTTYKLHDWCLSRQRYWGPPIPVIHCEKCGALPVPEKDLPVLLPEMEDYAPDGSGASPLARCASFVDAACPECGGSAKRETDVSDNFLDSAWYFFRYPSSGRDDAIFDPELTKKWLPADMYIGGNEHAVLHLMYTRFLTMAFKDMGLIDFDEPFKRFYAHGLLIKDGAKMSKSKGNVVNPDEFFGKYGADAFRMYLMFLGPFQEGGDFSADGIRGVRKFLDRVWRWVTETEASPESMTDPEALGILHRGIKKVVGDIECLHYNTAVAALMETLNALTQGGVMAKDAKSAFVRIMAPFCPHIAEELWERLGNACLVMDAGLPRYDEALCTRAEVEFIVQVDGKLRAKLLVPAGLSEEEAFLRAAKDERVRAYLEGKPPVKRVFIKDRLMNFVLR